MRFFHEKALYEAGPEKTRLFRKKSVRFGFYVLRNLRYKVMPVTPDYRRKRERYKSIYQTHIILHQTKDNSSERTNITNNSSNMNTTFIKLHFKINFKNNKD